MLLARVVRKALAAVMSQRFYVRLVSVVAQYVMIAHTYTLVSIATRVMLWRIRVCTSCARRNPQSAVSTKSLSARVTVSSVSKTPLRTPVFSRFCHNSHALGTNSGLDAGVLGGSGWYHSAKRGRGERETERIGDDSTQCRPRFILFSKRERGVATDCFTTHTALTAADGEAWRCLSFSSSGGERALQSRPGRCFAPTRAPYVGRTSSAFLSLVLSTSICGLMWPFVCVCLMKNIYVKHVLRVMCAFECGDSRQSGSAQLLLFSAWGGGGVKAKNI